MFIAATTLFHVDDNVQNHQAYQNRVRLGQSIPFSVPKGKGRGKKHTSIFSHFPQQLACPVSAATVDLGPLVEGGGDQIFLFEEQPAHARRGVVAAGPCLDKKYLDTNQFKRFQTRAKPFYPLQSCTLRKVIGN